MSETYVTPLEYHVNTLRNSERYPDVDNSEITTNRVSGDQLYHRLDEFPASVVDDITERGGQYENAEAFLSGEFGEPDRVTEILENEETRG